MKKEKLVKNYFHTENCLIVSINHFPLAVFTDKNECYYTYLVLYSFINTNFSSFELFIHTFSFFLKVHILWWPSFCNRSASLWPYFGRNNKRCGHKMGTPKWIPCGKTLWLGLSWSACCELILYSTVLSINSFIWWKDC